MASGCGVAQEGKTSMNEVVSERRMEIRQALQVALAIVATLIITVTSTGPLSAQVRPDVQQLLDEGINLFQQGKLSEAQQQFERALLLDVTSEEALDWVDQVGYGQLIQVIRSGDDTLGGQMATLLRLTSLETKRRSMDAAAITEVLDSYFGQEDLLERTKLLYQSISDHGVYLLPGLVDRLGQPEQTARVLAIQAVIRMSDDAVLPLTRCLHSTKQGIVTGAIASLQKIKNPVAIPSLRWLAESSADPLIQAAANAAADSIIAGSSDGDAYSILVDQAHMFSTDSSMMVRTYHDPVLWTISDGSLSYRVVEGWELNELRAEQLLGDALSLSGAGGHALALNACNLMARWSEYSDVRSVISRQVEAGDTDESQLANLRAREIEMERVRCSAYTMPVHVLDAALDLALTDRRPQVAINILSALRVFLWGQNDIPVSAAVQSALSYEQRGVRFAAARCVAFQNPSDSFSGSDDVVPNLAEGLAEGSRKVALTIFPDQDDALLIGSLLRRTNIEPFNDADPLRGLERAISFPKDVIAISSDTGKFPTAEVIRRLRGDYRTKRTPIIVFASGDGFAQAQATYNNEESGVFVVDRSIDPLRLRNDLLVGLLAGSDNTRGANVAMQAAQALRHLASRDSQFDLSTTTDALIHALDDPADVVRIPTCTVLAAMCPASASSALVRVIEEGDAASVDLRQMALIALGNIHRGTGMVDESVLNAVNSAMKSSDVKIIEAAARALGVMGIQPAVFKE
ncbi:MAG: HEAT repeat domain-containing protein [Planctomycetota bacterium]|nr:HEAT repeat domain-containing protein [Planctomycetota bacterium]